MHCLRLIVIIHPPEALFSFSSCEGVSAIDSQCLAIQVLVCSEEQYRLGHILVFPRSPCWYFALVLLTLNMTLLVFFATVRRH